MKLINLLFLVALLFGANSVNGQISKDFKKEIKTITGITKLSPDQSLKLNSVYEKIGSDLSNIEHLKATEEPKYRSKRRAIYKGAQFSIGQIFNEEQKAKYVNYQRGKRIEHAKSANKLRKKKASKDDILDAELGIKN